MRIEAIIRFPNERPVKLPLTSARLVSRDERKGNSPFPIGRANAQLFHVGVAGTVKRIDVGASKSWPKLAKQQHRRQDGVLNFFRKGLKLWIELIADGDTPVHNRIMISKPYGVKGILYRLILRRPA
jgi:hypothetical protein